MTTPTTSSSSSSSQAAQLPQETTTGFTHVPLELRDQIYDSLVANLGPTLEVPECLDGSGLAFLTRRLPPGLLVNRQVAEEAVMVFLRHTTLVVNGPGFSGLESLLSSFPDDAAYKNVRSLEFKHPHSCYTSSSAKPPSGAPADCIHDIVSRCSGLRSLTMTIPGGTLSSAGEGINPTTGAADDVLGLLHMLENDRLQKLHLVCHDGDQFAYTNLPLRPMFARLINWFGEEAAKRARSIDFTAKLCPEHRKESQFQWIKDAQLEWITSDGITSYIHHDFFG